MIPLIDLEEAHNHPNLFMVRKFTALEEKVDRIISILGKQMEANDALLDRILELKEKIIDMEKEVSVAPIVEEKEWVNKYNVGAVCFVCDAPRRDGSWCDTFDCGTSVGSGECGGLEDWKNEGGDNS